MKFEQPPIPSQEEQEEKEKFNFDAEFKQWESFYQENFPDISMPEVTEKTKEEINTAITEGLKDLLVVPKGLKIKEIVGKFENIWVAELAQRLIEEGKESIEEGYITMSTEMENSENKTSQEIEKILESKGLRGERMEEYLLRERMKEEKDRDAQYSYTLPASKIAGTNLAGNWSPVYRSYQINAIDPSFRSVYLKARAVKEIKL